MRQTVTALLCLTCLAAAGCGSVTAQRVGYDNDEVRGIRYWLPAPYLLVNQPVTVHEEQTLWRYQRDRLIPVCMGDPCPPGTGAGGTGGAAASPDATETIEAVDPGEQIADFGDGDADEGEKAAEEEDKKPGDGGKKSGGEGGKKPAPATAPEAISIVWLPDYCQMYAVRMTTGLGNQKLEMKFADGWQLSSVNSEIDNSKIIESFTDLAKTFLTTRADLETARIEAATPEEEEALAKERRVTPAETVLRRTARHILRPGLYRLITQENCSEPGLFEPEKFFGVGGAGKTVETVSWEKIEL